MASSSSFSYSSYARTNYDVFLSSTYELRQGFADHLYTHLRQAEINTFRNDEEICRGEDISTEVVRAIMEARLSIIILSSTYANSRWCLDELVKIMECKQQLNQIVFPIFYDVDPAEVRRQTGQFGNAFIHHSKVFGDKKVYEWKAALTMVANLSGWDLQCMPNGYKSKFVDSIIREVLSVLGFTPLNVVKYPVGIDSRVEDILYLLQTQINDDVKMIGIFGMGGIGKSTLAKAIYNHLIYFQGFEGSCFVADIRSKVSMRHIELVYLQEQLLRKTLHTKKFDGIDNVEEGKILIKDELQSKRVLIVLDDIDHINQLESLAGQRNWFGWGSVVIITTRNVNLLRDDLIKAHEKYKIETLSPDESLKLLSCYAFGVPVPPEEYTELSKIFVSYTGGLPLALTVLGPHLRERSVEEWSNDVEKLRLMPLDDVYKILKISYDALDDDTQGIFLDIAYFFIGQDINDIVQDFGSQFKIGIRTLTERCMLTIHRSGEKEKLQMHALIWEMAREIVRKESPQDPSKQSRLRDPSDVYDVINGNKGTEAIEGIYVDSNMLKNKPLSTKVLSRMKKLWLLKLDGVDLERSFKYLPKELRWFWWHNSPLRQIPSNFRHEKLEVLHLQGSNIERVQLKIQHFKSLKILNFGGCEQLESTPDFSDAHSLQILSFKYCKNLVKLNPSIGRLEGLIELDLAFCQNLKELPSSICQLKSLEFLYLNDCSSLGNFTFDLGKLEKLRKLLAHSTDISLLPISLGQLLNLKILSVGWRKDLLPPPPPPKSKSQSFDISLLVSFFPHTFGDLCSLEALYITDNHLRDKELFDLRRLSSLKVLSLKGSYYLQSFPFSLCSLSRLESLELEECPNLNQLLQLPPSLLKLSAKNCPSLTKIEISTLERLKELYIPNCKSLVELPGLESLDSIQRLDITNCSSLNIPLIESCYQAYSKGGDVEIWLQMVGSFLYCTIPSQVLRRKFFDIIHGGFDPNYSTSEVCIIVRSRMTGASIVKKVKHVDCRCLEHRHHQLTLHFRLEDDIVINTSERFHFKVRIEVGEELELYAVFQEPLKIFSLCVLHRNSRDGDEVRFFPSTKGFIEFVELAAEERRNMWEKEAYWFQNHEIIEDSPSQFHIRKQFQKKVPKAIMSSPPSVPLRRGEKKGPSPRVPGVAKKPRIDENTSSEKIQKLLDEATRLVAEGSKLKRRILEFLDVALLLRSKEEAMAPELSALLNMLKVQSKGGYTTALETTQCLLEALKNYEVEQQNDTTGTGSSVVEREDVSSDDSEPHLPTKKSYNNEGRLPEKPERIDNDEVVELFFTPKKFEGQIVVKLGEAIEVTGTGMYSLKPGEMIQDDVINSYEFILRERAGNQPKCWYLPTYICQETQANYSVKMYERNFQPYVTNSSCDIIYLPLFLNSHWYLVKANTKSRQAFILDSYITYNQRKSRLEEAIKIMRVLHNLLKDHTLRDPTYQYEADFEDWEFEMASWVPQQSNGVDCGVFVMLFMEMADQLINHTEFNIDMERRRIALQLLYHPRNATLSLVLENL